MHKLAELILQDAQSVCARIDFNELEGKSMLITGASGLAGTHFLACLNHLKSKEKLSFKVYSLINSNPSEYFKELTGFKGSEMPDIFSTNIFHNYLIFVNILNFKFISLERNLSYCE